MNRPLAIDLFCGLGGWTDGLLAEGYDVIGVDIEQHVYGEHRYPGMLVIQDVLTLHGSQFRNAALIVASPPCQEYSYMAMPWSKAKQKAAEYRSGVRDVKELNALFDACFRIQREACEAAGRHIPLIVENVRGAEQWVGRAKWKSGAFYFWGDVPALMPIYSHVKLGGSWFHGYRKGQGPRNHGSKSKARKAASAMIAKIPLPLSRHIAQAFHSATPRADASASMPSDAPGTAGGRSPAVTGTNSRASAASCPALSPALAVPPRLERELAAEASQ